MAINDPGSNDKHTSKIIVEVDGEKSATILIGPDTQELLDEASMNGVHPANFIGMMMLLATMAARQGVYPDLTNKAVGRV